MIMLNSDEQKVLSEHFLDHFGLAGSGDTMIWHPLVTKPGHLHIDIYQLHEDGYYYLYSVGGSGRENHNGKHCEVYLRFRDNLPEDLTKKITSERASLHSAAGFNEDTELLFLDDNEYTFFDDADELWIGKLGRGEFCGLFIYESFCITSGYSVVTYYEAVPASRAELSFIESHRNVSYKELISAFKPYLGDRTDLQHICSLTQKKMEDIYQELNRNISKCE